MVGDVFMRRALRATAVMNLGGAVLFAFPDSVGRIAGLPAPVPHLYSLFIAFMVALFGVTYAWLARQPRIDRPLVAFAAIGKSGFFAVTFVCWAAGEVSLRGAIGAGADLAFAAIFAAWLLSAPAAHGAAFDSRAA